MAEEEKEFCHRLDKQLAVFEARTEGEFKSRDVALALEKKETARRLEILNGEAERLRDMQATYLPREVWENAKAELDKEIRGLNQFRNNFQGRQSIIIAVVSIGVSVFVIILNKYLF